jgi:indolepyruvate ferredoxin oxidoreductase, beta subunit
MKFDIIIAGVGGQGVLSIGAIISAAAMRGGLLAVQSEVHGMSQRGGAVVSHLRLADIGIHSPTITRGSADLILGLEPLEALRYVDSLSAGGALISATEPVQNIPDYPPMEEVLWSILRLPRGHLIEAAKIAREAGAAKAANVVIVGAATDFLPIDAGEVRCAIADAFRAKGERLVDVNLAAFEAGRRALQHREVVDEFETFAVTN